MNHNKLVRDKIPEILENKNVQVKTRILEEDEFIKELKSKLQEESLEASTADEEHLLEELGDLETVVDAILKEKGFTRTDLSTQQQKKDLERGTFEKKIYLEETIENK